jgi:hypothetical protein
MRNDVLFYHFIETCSSSHIIRPLSSKATPLIRSNFIYTEINTTKLSPSREDTFTLQNGWSYKRGKYCILFKGVISRGERLFFCFCSFWLYCIAVCLLFPLFNSLHNIVGEIYNTVLSVYSHEDDRPLPQSDEVLLCTPHTSLDMVNNCLNLILNTPNSKL